MSETALNKISQGLKKLSQLKKLYLSMNLRHISDKGIGILGNALKRQVLLEDLCLYLYFCLNITDFGLKKWSQGLGTLRSLRNLRLILSKCDSGRITNAGFDCFSKAISKLTQLRSFDITCISQSGNGPDIGLKSLGQSLKRLESLKNIGLFFAGYFFRIEIFIVYCLGVFFELFWLLLINIQPLIKI